MIFEIDDISIEVSKKSIKNANLRIYPPDGHVKMSVPVWYNKTLIKKLVREKSAWIRTHQERFRQKSSKDPNPALLQTTLAFKGQNYPIIYENSNNASEVLIQGKSIYCYTSPYANEFEKQSLIESWYKQEMYALLPDLIAHWEQIMKVNVAQWGIKKMKTRWGSCNPAAKRIWLNLGLIQKPPVCLEYVLVHELTHLLEPSHNQRFHALMTHFMPQWRTYKQVLEGREHFCNKECS